VSVASGIAADITVGPTRSVVAETESENFNVLRISVKGALHGDFSVTSSSGGEVDVSGVNGGNVEADTSLGDISIAGNCASLECASQEQATHRAGGGVFRGRCRD
jgi:hypothetical protein